jgi:hypothetical protein
MGYLLLGYLLFFGLSVGLEKMLPRRWVSTLGLAQLVIGGLALVFGLCTLTPDLLILLNLSHAPSVGAGFGLLVGGFFAITGGMLLLAGRMTRGIAAEWAEEDAEVTTSAGTLDEIAARVPSPATPVAAVPRMSIVQKVVLVLFLAAVVGGITALGIMNATTLKGAAVLREELRSDSPAPLEFNVGAPLGQKYLIVVNTGTVEAWRSHKTERAGYKFVCTLLDPNGREVFRTTDEYYSSVDRVIELTPTTAGTYRLSVRPTGTVKDARTYPSVRVYRNDRRILPAFCSQIGLWTD